MKQRLLNILIATDQWLFVFLSLGYADPDWTISAAAWRWELEGKRPHKYLRPIIDTLFWFDDNHCQESYWKEVSR